MNNAMLQSLLKMSGVSSESFNQLILVKSMMEKLSPEEATRVMTNFVEDLQKAVEKVEGGKEVDAEK